MSDLVSGGAFVLLVSALAGLPCYLALSDIAQDKRRRDQWGDPAKRGWAHWRIWC